MKPDDDLFFVFLDTVEKLKPRVVIAENVAGLVRGNAKGYVREIVERFHQLGYNVQIFLLNSALMDVPQKRERVFFIANNFGAGKLLLNFDHQPIYFGTIRTERDEPINEGTVVKSLADAALPGEDSLADVARRIAGTKDKYFTTYLTPDDAVAWTVTSSTRNIRLYDRMYLSDEDIRRAQSFPADYDFNGNDPAYVCGMSVPPNMMANIAMEVWEQWLK